MALPNQFYPKDTPFGKLSCEEAFKGLKPQEKRYAHFMSRASWYGQLIVFHQTSPEAPLIFIFLDKVLRSKPTLDGVTTNLKEQFSFTDDDVKAFLVYCGAFFSAGGNYRAFGDTKFVPDVPINKMQTVLRSLFPEDQDFWAEHCLEPMYDFKESVRIRGFPPHGINSYWSSNCNEKDAAIVAEFLTGKRLDAYNQRAFKEVVDGKTSYEIRVASRQLSNETDTTAEKLLSLHEDRNGIQFRVRRGDYSSLLGDVIESLESASKEAANENQRNMLREYVKYFETGSIQAHKDGSRSWVMDKGPAVETYIGFIENYRDPAGARAEFEGFVAVVNREGSKRLGVLVEKAEAVIKESMPWPRPFEKDSYLKPDFTALDIISFASSGVPIGINIPNYNEIRQNEGFKNVHLENSMKARMSAAEIDFVTKTDADLLKKYREAALEVQVGLHELLGHGTGKLFEKDPVKGANFDVSTVNPLTGKPVETWYTAGQTYDSKFGNMSSTYEECRAEAIGIYLTLERHILEIFGHVETQQQDDIVYANWLMMVLAGLRSLETYDPDAKKWGQAHSQARYVILRVLLESAPGLVTIEESLGETDKKPDLRVTLKREEIHKKGKQAMRDFLVKLQVYKSLADIKEASKMYLRLSEVPAQSQFANWRDIVIARKKPRMILVQSNTRLNAASNEVELLSYPNTPEGFAQSWIDRHANPDSIYDSMLALYKKDQKHFQPEKN